MKLKLQLSELRRQLICGTFEEQRPQAAALLGWIFHFGISFTLSAVPFLGGCGPFGIAAVARTFDGIGNFVSLAGAVCGYLIVFPFQEGVKFVSAAVLMFAASYASKELKVHYSAFFLPTVAAVVTLLTGFLGYYVSEAGKNILIPLISQTMLAFGCSYFFREAFSSEERMTESADLRHGISVMILVSCILMALSGAMVMSYISVGRIIAIVFVQAVAFRSGAFPGAAAGLTLGIAMDAAASAPVFYSAAYAFSALISSVFSRRGRIAFAVSFLLCAGVTVFLSLNQGIRAEMFPECLSASILFLLLPRNILSLISSLLKNAVPATGESGIRRYTARRLMGLSAAFQDLHTTVDSALAVKRNDENITEVFDRAADQICVRCGKRSECWNKGYLNTLNVFNDVSTLIRSRGILTEDDLPETFREQCLRPQELVGAVNGELRGRMYRKQFQAKLSENRSAAYQQYLDVSEILSEASEELENAFGPDLLTQRRLSRYLASMDLDADISAFRDRSGRLHILLESAKLKRLLREPGYLDRLSEAVGVRLCRPNGSDERCEGRISLMEAEPLSVSVGVASVKKTGETVSGDRGTYFKTEQGVLCILLSDGMGSGESAAKESVAAIRILERFLRTGVDPAAAMKILNSVMLLKNESDWGFATVDLLCIDLFSGDAAFYKYGAAPSYIKAGKQIRRVRCENLAAGLSSGKDAQPDMVKMRLHPGNLALIASDGVLAETDDAWVRKLLSEGNPANMKELAKEALQTALQKYGCSDDMTVLTVRVDQRA